MNESNSRIKACLVLQNVQYSVLLRDFGTGLHNFDIRRNNDALFQNQRTIGPINAHLTSWSRFHEKIVYRFWRRGFFTKWPWPSIPSLAQLVISIYQLSGYMLLSEKSTVLILTKKSRGYQIWPCPKIGQGQPRVTIWTNYDGLVPDSTYQVSWKSLHWLRRRRYFKSFTIYGHSSHLDHVINIMIMNFHFPVSESLH